MFKVVKHQHCLVASLCSIPNVRLEMLLCPAGMLLTCARALQVNDELGIVASDRPSAELLREQQFDSDEAFGQDSRSMSYNYARRGPVAAQLQRPRAESRLETLAGMVATEGLYPDSAAPPAAGQRRTSQTANRRAWPGPGLLVQREEGALGTAGTGGMPGAASAPAQAAAEQPSLRTLEHRSTAFLQHLRQSIIVLHAPSLPSPVHTPMRHTYNRLLILIRLQPLGHMIPCLQKGPPPSSIWLVWTPLLMPCLQPEDSMAWLALAPHACRSRSFIWMHPDSNVFRQSV